MCRKRPMVRNKYFCEDLREAVTFPLIVCYNVLLQTITWTYTYNTTYSEGIYEWSESQRTLLLLLVAMQTTPHIPHTNNTNNTSTILQGGAHIHFHFLQHAIVFAHFCAPEAIWRY